MPAFTFNTNKINISLAYDALTMYFKFKRWADTGKYTSHQVTTACHQIKTILIPEVGISIDAENFDFSKEEVRGKIATDRYIHRDDDDHDLYHHDSFDKDELHVHMKFKAGLTRDQLSMILDILVAHNLVTSDEKIVLLAAYDGRFESSRNQLDRILGGQFGLDPISDYQKINLFIRTIEDNDLLDDLHTYLLSDTFDALRSNPAGETSIWQGTNAAGEVVKTSQLWAMIEKSITLQMGHNVEKGCQFTAKLARDWATELSRHRFFAVKHQLSGVADRARDSESPSVEAFRNWNTTTFDREYNSHFKAII